MYHADRIWETSTTSGAITTGSSIALAGAVAANQAFSARVKAGDPCHVTIVDGGGSRWIAFEGTLTDSSHVRIDTIEDSSSGIATGITLTSNTHQVMLTFGAEGLNKRLVFADCFLDFVASGLLLPSAGDSGGLVGTMTAGVAYAVGQRIVKGAQAHTYTASKDTYVDLSNDGTLTYSAVTNGAGAAAVAANSIRLGKVVTDGTHITSAATSGLDSLHNTMRNTSRMPMVSAQVSGASVTLASAGGPTGVAFGSGTTVVDNAGMHSESVNNSRFTVVQAGAHLVSCWFRGTMASAPTVGNFYVYARKNATDLGSLINKIPQSGTDAYTYAVSGILILAANDYVELSWFNGFDHDVTLTQAKVDIVRIG